MAQSVQLKHHSVLYASRLKPQRGKGPYVYKQTYLAFTSISRLLFNAVVYMASLSLRQEVMTRQRMTLTQA